MNKRFYLTVAVNTADCLLL